MTVLSNDLYKHFIYKRSYSRWDNTLDRRENWNETVDRYRKFFLLKLPNKVLSEFKVACKKVEDMEIMPSMRALWSAGKALERDNLAGYNCTYLTIDNLKAFSEMIYILMNGAGVGFSVERQYINNLPTIPDTFKNADTEIVFRDSKKGWAEGFNRYIKELYKGNIYKCNLSKLRPKGAVLKTFGGRASGPEPLKRLIDFTELIVTNNAGRKLSSINCYDICCFIANVIVSGGARRSATISLSNLSDDRMAVAKKGAFWTENPQRALSNNSVAYTEKPDSYRFIKEWLSLMESKSGERGLFNRSGAKIIVSRVGRREIGFDFGTNPCGEVILRPRECCNLSEVIIRSEDDKKTLIEKVKYATILGCVQSTLTNFSFVSIKWKNNCEEERLLGVSLTGLADHPVLNKVSRHSKRLLLEMKEEAIATAEEWASLLDINMPTAITCVKPSGTVSQLVGCSSGLHPRYSQYYIRRVRVATSDPLCRFLVDKKIKHSPEVGESYDTATTFVFEFFIKSPDKSIMRSDVNAIQQLEFWKMLQDYWCEHTPSITVYVKDNEWLEVGAWVYKNWNNICGLSFLPYDSGVYQLAPYEEIDEDTYDQLKEEYPDMIDYSELSEYETSDTTEGSKEFACTAGGCEI